MVGDVVTHKGGTIPFMAGVFGGRIGVEALNAKWGLGKKWIGLGLGSMVLANRSPFVIGLACAGGVEAALVFLTDKALEIRARYRE